MFWTCVFWFVLGIFVGAIIEDFLNPYEGPTAVA